MPSSIHKVILLFCFALPLACLGQSLESQARKIIQKYYGSGDYSHPGGIALLSAVMSTQLKETDLMILEKIGEHHQYLVNKNGLLSPGNETFLESYNAEVITLFRWGHALTNKYQAELFTREISNRQFSYTYLMDNIKSQWKVIKQVENVHQYQILSHAREQQIGRDRTPYEIFDGKLSPVKSHFAARAFGYLLDNTRPRMGKIYPRHPYSFYGMLHVDNALESDYLASLKVESMDDYSAFKHALAIMNHLSGDPRGAEIRPQWARQLYGAATHPLPEQIAILAQIERMVSKARNGVMTVGKYWKKDRVPDFLDGIVVMINGAAEMESASHTAVLSQALKWDKGVLTLDYRVIDSAMNLTEAEAKRTYEANKTSWLKSLVQACTFGF